MGVNIPFGRVFQGAESADTLDGSAGSDPIFGFGGDDLLNGMDGNDVIFDGLGNDIINGNLGDDVLNGGPGFNLMSGGEGNDVALAGPDRNLQLGGEGADQLIGGDGTDVLIGGAGNDLLVGGKGVDVAIGGAGDDVMDTGTGLGLHFGGAGADTFQIGNEILDNGEVDQIIALDFTAGEDLLDLGDSILGAVTGMEDTQIDLSSALGGVEDTGFFEADLASRLEQLDGGSTLSDEFTGVLSSSTIDPTTGGVAASGVIVSLQGGDQIAIAGVSSDELMSLLGTPPSV